MSKEKKIKFVTALVRGAQSGESVVISSDLASSLLSAMGIEICDGSLKNTCDCGTSLADGGPCVYCDEAVA